MSFMFNPFPYDDPNAINRIDAKGINTASVSVGNDSVRKAFVAIVKKGGVIALDGYTTAPFDAVLALAGDVRKIAVSSVLKSPAELREREVTGETIEELHEAEDVLLEEKKK